jgi:hypothetical protein
MLLRVAFAVLATVFPVTCHADVLSYATTGDDLFGLVDLNTGVFTETGNMGLRLTGLGENRASIAKEITNLDIGFQRSADLRKTCQPNGGRG